ncbi:MAG: hypothetical protein ACHQF4_06640 [Sphingobacteriales bacterium]
MKNKLLLLIICILPFLSQAQVKTIAGNDIVNLKTFTTVLSDAVMPEKIDDYFNPLGYKFTGMEDISRHGMQGHELTYKGDHSDFKVDLVGRLKLTVTYITKAEVEYNTMITDIKTTNGYKPTDHANSGLASWETFANNDYVFVFMKVKTQNGTLYSINASSKLNNIVVNGDNNQ